MIRYFERIVLSAVALSTTTTPSFVTNSFLWIRQYHHHHHHHHHRWHQFPSARPQPRRLRPTRKTESSISDHCSFVRRLTTNRYSSSYISDSYSQHNIMTMMNNSRSIDDLSSSVSPSSEDAAYSDRKNTSVSTMNPSGHLPTTPNGYETPVVTLCPKCHGEGKLASRIKSFKNAEKKKKSHNNDEEGNIIIHQPTNNKRIKRDDNDDDDSKQQVNDENENAESVPSSSSLPSSSPPPQLRWDPCHKCDQTGLLFSAPSIPIENQFNDNLANTTSTPNMKTSSSSLASSPSKQPPIPHHHRPPRPLHVAIVGGGIGGLALATALYHRNISCTVYERDHHFYQRSQGYGLTLQQARRALQALGINDTFNNNSNDNDNNNNEDDINSSIIDNRQLHNRKGDTKNCLNSTFSQLGGKYQSAMWDSITSTKHIVHMADGTIVGEWGIRKWGRPTDKKKPKRQNLHVARQILRYALWETLQSAIQQQRNQLDVCGSGDSEMMMTTDTCIRWGHKLVHIQHQLVSSEPNNEGKSHIDNVKSKIYQQIPQSKVQLTFQVPIFDINTGEEDWSNLSTVTEMADIVVGCDGIRSTVRQSILEDTHSHNTINEGITSAEEYSKKNVIRQSATPTITTSTPLRYLDCIVILGICPIDVLEESSKESPLLDGETVFQTADGSTRIYLMPYSKQGPSSKYMWQLSFPIPNEEVAKELSRRGPAALKEEAMKKCHDWHSPIPDILNKTPIEFVSGYPVYDRDLLTTDMLDVGRRKLQPRRSVDGEIDDGDNEDDDICELKHNAAAPVTLLGDAAHPMSPFKGQGANQALLDALSLARSLYRIYCRKGQSIQEAIQDYEEEMTTRSARKVQASSEAAQFLHTDVAIQEGNMTRGAAAAAAATATAS
jgi:salicylate hydroxylase